MMRKFFILAILCLLPWAAHAENTIGPSNQVLCTKLTNNSLTGTGASVTTSLLASIAGKTIFICGWQVTESGTTAGTFQLEYGTQTTTPCDTGTTILTPGYSVTSTAPATDHVSVASLSLPISTQLCLVTTGAVTSTLQVGIWVGQY